MFTIEVILTPVLYFHKLTEYNHAVAIVDVLRATTSIVAAFMTGVSEIIPVASEEEAIEYKEKGYLIAAEKDGIQLPFANFGNSPFVFLDPNLKNSKIAYLTTNGTKTMKIINDTNDKAIASFLNLSAIVNWFFEKQKNVVILCSGWKNKFNLEDTILAGSIVEKLIQNSEFRINCDAAQAALDLWLIAKKNPLVYIQKALHRERLRKLGLDDVLEFCFTSDKTHIVPLLQPNGIIKINTNAIVA